MLFVAKKGVEKEPEWLHMIVSLGLGKTFIA